jgi:hypothetical protein
LRNENADDQRRHEDAQKHPMLQHLKSSSPSVVERRCADHR